MAISAIVLLLLSLASVLQAHGPLEIETTLGRIRGKVEENPSVTAFYGIPFAAAPLGNLRFRQPQPHATWNNTRDCTRDDYFHICPQFHIEKNIVLGQEDCLYMNIYVPGTYTANESLPVMFWIYGGGFTIGDGFEFGFYRGKNMAATRNVIVVEFNYRLSAFGFIALPALQTESSDGSVGNYGLQDQQAALKFMSQNIKAFGGDPTKVTIFGESAGAFSVCWHLVSQVSRPYFSAAIMESGTCESAEFFVTLPRAFHFGSMLASILGCNQTVSADVVQCLRTKSVVELFPAAWPNPDQQIVPPLAPGMPFGPVIDGVKEGLLSRPINLIQTGMFAQVPVILGTNKDEGTAFVYDAPSVIPGVKLPLSETTAKKCLQHFFNDTTADEVDKTYDIKDFKNQDVRMAAVLRDYFFTCSNRKTARAISSFGVPVFLYQFTMALPNWVDYDVLGDYHSLELPFVFDHAWPIGVHDFTPTEQALASAFTYYWTNLGKYGSPNPPSLKKELYWPAYNASTDINIVLEQPLKTDSGLYRDQCDFWDTRYSKYYFD